MENDSILHTIGDNFRYRVYQTSSVETLDNKQIIGVANSYQEACLIIKDHLAVNNFHQEPYWRFLMDEKATFIDYGSWSKFIAIIPPISINEITKEES